MAHQRITRGRRPGPVVRYVVTFGILVAAMYASLGTRPVQEQLFPGYLRLNAQLAAGISSRLGEPAVAAGNMVTARRFSVEVRQGCDAVEPSALFVLAVVASPVAIWTKLPGMLIGTLVLAGLNLVRIVSLLFVGLRWPRAFEVLHVEVWQPIFIVAAIALWMSWGVWALRIAEARRVRGALRVESSLRSRG